MLALKNKMLFAILLLFILIFFSDLNSSKNDFAALDLPPGGGYGPVIRPVYFYQLTASFINIPSYVFLKVGYYADTCYQSDLNGMFVSSYQQANPGNGISISIAQPSAESKTRVKQGLVSIEILGDPLMQVKTNIRFRDLSLISGFFNGFTELTTFKVSNLAGYSFSQNSIYITNCTGMFSDCPKLRLWYDFDLFIKRTGLTYQVTSLESMFAGCTNLDTIDFIKTWDFRSVTNMSNMFGTGSKDSLLMLEDVDFSNIDFSSVTNMTKLFMNSSITTLNLTGCTFNPNADFTDMFKGCGELKHVTGTTNQAIISEFYKSFRFVTFLGVNDNTYAETTGNIIRYPPPEFPSFGINSVLLKPGYQIKLYTSGALKYSSNLDYINNYTRYVLPIDNTLNGYSVTYVNPPPPAPPPTPSPTPACVPSVQYGSCVAPCGSTNGTQSKTISGCGAATSVSPQACVAPLVACPTPSPTPACVPSVRYGPCDGAPCGTTNGTRSMTLSGCGAAPYVQYAPCSTAPLVPCPPPPMYFYGDKKVNGQLVVDLNNKTGTLVLNNKSSIPASTRFVGLYPGYKITTYDKSGQTTIPTMIYQNNTRQQNIYSYDVSSNKNPQKYLLQDFS